MLHRNSDQAGASGHHPPPPDRDLRLRRAFGRRLALLRGERELTQKEIGRTLGTTQEVISRYERGKYAPSLALLLDLRRLFGVTVDYLVAGVEPGEIADPRLHKLALAADRLPPEHRTLVVTALRGLIEAAQADARRAHGGEDEE